MMLVEQLPPESRTKTAQRDLLDPYDLAEAAEADGPRRGWGPHGRIDERLCQIGERLDHIGYLLVRTSPGGGSARQPSRWRRPGVLGHADTSVIEEAIAAPVINQLEAERAEREARRRAQSTSQ